MPRRFAVGAQQKLASSITSFAYVIVVRGSQLATLLIPRPLLELSRLQCTC